MQGQWSAVRHLKFYRNKNDQPVSVAGFTIKKRKGEEEKFVSDIQEFETTDLMRNAYLFSSKDSAEAFADRMNAFERMKKEWIEKASL